MSYFKLFTNGLNSKNIYKNYENVILSKSGKELYISWYNTIYHSHSDKIIGLASIGVNITKSKDYERKLEEKNYEYQLINRQLTQAKEKAEESDRLKSAFLANMSHEIRTPMSGILGFTNLLLEPELSDEKKEAYIRIIHQSGERMLNTVNDIVEISKIEAGMVDAHNSMINVNE